MHLLYFYSNWGFKKFINKLFVTSPLKDGVHRSDDRIINGGGIGMRMLEANGVDVIPNDTTYDYTYRENTDIITSVMVQVASGDITPDTRHKEKDTRKSAYTNPPDGKAYVTITANGQSTTMAVVINSLNSSGSLDIRR